MAIVVKDRVQQLSTTTGTSDFVVGGSVSGYQPFSAIGDNTTYYCAVDPNTGDWEVGIGTYTDSTTTLTRTTVLESSNSGNKVDFATGTRNVFCTYPAEKAIYEEVNGNVLVDGGPLTVVGTGVAPGYTTFSAALSEMYGDVNTFAQSYARNLNDGSEASADMIVYRDNTVTEDANFMDMGINSSNFSSATWPIFTANSMYLYGNGGEMFIGSETDDVVFFAGGVDTTDEVGRFSATTGDLTLENGLNVTGALDVTGAATFGSTVLLDADPTLDLQAATKQYVDNAVSNGFHVHSPVLVATTANLTATYANGTLGVGATLTNSGTQAAIEIDGVSLSTSDRVLVWSQTAPAENGVYTVTTVGSGSTNWVLTRASDADTYVPQSDTGLGGGDYFFVESGSTYGFSSFVCTNDGAIVFGTTGITFQLFSTVPSYVVQSPLDLTGNTLSLAGTVAATNGGTGTATVTTGDLLYGSGTNTWSKLAKGAAYRSLVMNAGATNVEWNAVALNQSNAVSGSLGATNGGTGQSTYTLGDTLYSSAANTLSKLAGNTTTTKKWLNQTGTGSASAAPTWSAIANTDVSGLGTMSTQNANNVAITGGTIQGVAISGASTIDNTDIGDTTPAAVRGVTMEASNGIMANATTVSANYSLPSGYNALSAGPISVNSGVTVTIPTGSVWTVV